MLDYTIQLQEIIILLQGIKDGITILCVSCGVLSALMVGILFQGGLNKWKC